MNSVTVPTPRLPVEYETAIQALIECQTLDESRYWSDKADALAAWAKIYRSKKAEIESRKLKLHAYRRMGQLAIELRPHRPIAQTGRSGAGFAPGPLSLLKEHGFNARHASAATHLGKLTPAAFNSLVESPKPPIPTGLFRGVTFSDGWRRIYQTFMAMRSVLRHVGSARELARSLRPEERAKAIEMATEIAEWLDEFQQHLAHVHTEAAPSTEREIGDK